MESSTGPLKHRHKVDGNYASVNKVTKILDGIITGRFNR